jgi:hypothetical protein
MKYFSRFTLLALISISVLVSTAAAQRRDFVTEQEGKLIREAQEIDLRIEALTKFIDRRLAAANIAGHTWTPPKKNSELWGPEPTGSRSELLSDIKRLLQKSIDDIDDIASRTSTAIEGNEVGGKLFPKAVRNLAAAATRYKPIFEAELGKSKSNTDRGLLIQSIEFCDQIIEAASQVPAEEPKKKKT